MWNSRIRTQRISKLATLASHLHPPKEGATTAINLRASPDQLVLPSVQLLDDLQPFRVLAWNSDRIRVEYEFKDRLVTMQNQVPNFHDFAAELFPRHVDLSVNGAVMSDCRLGLWRGNLHLPPPTHTKHHHPHPTNHPPGSVLGIPTQTDYPKQPAAMPDAPGNTAGEFGTSGSELQANTDSWYLLFHWAHLVPFLRQSFLMALLASWHFNDVIIRRMASQITGASIVYSTVGSGIDKNIKVPRHWPWCEEFTGYRWIPRTKG